MDLEATALGVLVLGLLLGLKHATDADHVVAVTTIVNDTLIYSTQFLMSNLIIGSFYTLGIM